MIVDIDQADALPPAEHYDVCIAGAGVAGIVLAATLARRGRRVLLLEAGALDYTEESQSIYVGENLGREYFDLDVTRLRFLGGSSNHWSGWCRPLDAYDFLRRDHISESGWPITIAELQPHLERARDILEIAPFPPDVDLASANVQLKEIYFQSSPPVRFQEKYIAFLESAENLHVYINANVISIQLDPAADRIAAFGFRGYRDEASVHTTSADQYVLAMGGIENARVLLNADDQKATGLGNENGLVGHYFMEHPHHILGYYVVEPKLRSVNYRFFAPTPEMMSREKIANCGLRLDPVLEPGELSLMAQAEDTAKRVLCASDIVADFVRSVQRFRCPLPLEAGVLRVASEQVPNRNSRVQLTDQTDRFGQRRVGLNWQLSPIDKHTMRTAGMALGRYFAERDIGRIKLVDWILARDDFVPGSENHERLAGHHHMGTTRMGASPTDGVVDPNCRVFGVDNLYVAGSSVFRTGGHANPTLTIVQLALRLADHLSKI